MARGEIFETRPEKIVSGGAALSRIEGKSVFIEFAAPGDLVKCRIIKEYRDRAEGEILEVLEPSPLRVKPVCSLYGKCGGCSLQHLGYEHQIEAKEKILREAFKRIAGAEVPMIRIKRSEPYGYRNRVQFHYSIGKGPCFKERKSSSLVVIKDCPVADNGIRKALKEGLFTPPRDRERFTIYSRGETFLSEGGIKRGAVRILDKNLLLDAGIFFQSNASMLEHLIRDLTIITAGADQNLPMADIYCGVGTFAAFLGEKFPRIDLVEVNKTALALARENVKNIKVNCFALSDTDWVKSTGMKAGPFGFIIIDPPREGLSGPLREWIAGNGPDLVAYVSCDPATLARDSRELLQGGYMLKELFLYDFYPQTAHIESLAVFSRRGNEI